MGSCTRNHTYIPLTQLEFFVSPAALDVLVEHIAQHPYMTFYAVNYQGDLRTNTKGDSPNAVTFGVFPGQEIMQPTIVEGTSFMAWKDEAFELWRQWGTLYAAGSGSAKLIEGIQKTWLLVNLVDNNYKSKYSIFDMLDACKAEINGVVDH
jgi:methylenetetrahydrofolate reductase (NADPH)